MKAYKLFIISFLSLGLAFSFSIVSAATTIGTNSSIDGDLTAMGFVGIGTTTPTERLHVVENINDAVIALVENLFSGDTAVAQFQASSDASSLQMGATSSLFDGFLGFDTSSFIYSDQKLWVLSDDSLRFITGGVDVNNERMRIDSAGNVGIGTTAPDALLHIGSAAPGAFKLVDTTEGTAGSILTNVNGDGVGTWTAAAVTASGTYTPTFTSVANLDSITGTDAQYMRVGNTVTVSGGFTADPFAPATLTDFRISLPIASTLTSPEYAAGVANSWEAEETAQIYGDSSSDEALVTWRATSTTDHYWSYNYTYRIN